jgi:phosphoribosylglycinamide formyltransferase-1
MFKIAALISGGGSNLQSVIDAIETGSLPAQLVMVLADRPAAGLNRAEKHGIPSVLLNRKDYGSSLSKILMEHIPEDTDLIILAGYLSILTSEFIERWKGKIINIHPSLLPDFGGKGMYGMNVHKAVLEAGREISGCSVHYVDTGVDTGEIILQKKVPVLSGDTPELLQARVLEKEHKLLVESIQLIIKNRQQ